MPYLTVNVTQEDIDNGQEKSYIYCPIARAVRTDERDWYVEKKRICSFGGKTIIPLPLKAQKFIKAFDAGKPVKPFTFRLKLPE